MKEVEITIKFITPCLGNVRRKDSPDEMLKDAQGRIIFLPAWWKVFAHAGARLMSKHQQRVADIRWNPIVTIKEGAVEIYKRFYTDTEYKEHESFLPGTTISIKAMIPDGIPIVDLKELLGIAGTYQGFSPYGHGNRFGYLEVAEIQHSHRSKIDEN